MTAISLWDGYKHNNNNNNTTNKGGRTEGNQRHKLVWHREMMIRNVLLELPLQFMSFWPFRFYIYQTKRSSTTSSSSVCFLSPKSFSLGRLVYHCSVSVIINPFCFLLGPTSSPMGPCVALKTNNRAVGNFVDHLSWLLNVSRALWWRLHM